MKVSIKHKQTLTADLPNGTEVVSNTHGWVTWLHKGKYIIHICTCRVKDFECQNNTFEIRLFPSEAIAIAKSLLNFK
jgi:hypothetical protein